MSQDPSTPVPFHVEILDEELERMKRLIADTRLPDEPFIPEASWDYGVDLAWLKSMRDAWLHDFDWREVEKRMNAVPQFKVMIEGVNVHFMHKKSDRSDAIPILLLNGWPGSFWEFIKVIEPLTNPPPDKPAFHVVVPSLPGFGFSSAPPRKGWTMHDNARIFDHLMTGVLGYPSYIAQGGDWGSLIAMILGTDTHPACKLVHLNMLYKVPPTLGAWLSLPIFLLPTSWRDWLFSKVYTADERRDFARSFEFIKSGISYFLQQGTRPLTIGYAIYDSPIGLLCWVGEKYKERIDPSLISEHTEDVLTTLSIYYLTGTFPATTLPYYENPFREGLRISKPYGVSQFPYDLFLFPVSWLKKTNPNLVFMRRHERGGHFPAMEVPEDFVGDLQDMVSQFEGRKTAFGVV